MINRVRTNRVVQWLSGVFKPQERKKENIAVRSKRQVESCIFVVLQRSCYTAVPSATLFPQLLWNGNRNNTGQTLGKSPRTRLRIESRTSLQEWVCFQNSVEIHAEKIQVRHAERAWLARHSHHTIRNTWLFPASFLQNPPTPPPQKARETSLGLLLTLPSPPSSPYRAPPATECNRLQHVLQDVETGVDYNNTFLCTMGCYIYIFNIYMHVYIYIYIYIHIPAIWPLVLSRVQLIRVVSRFLKLTSMQ